MMPKLVFFRFIILILSVTCYVPVPWIVVEMSQGGGRQHFKLLLVIELRY